MPKKGSTAVKVTFMTMTLVTAVTAVKFDYPTVQFRALLNASALLFGRTIKYCVTNIGRKFPTSLSTLSYKTPVIPTDST